MYFQLFCFFIIDYRVGHQSDTHTSYFILYLVSLCPKNPYQSSIINHQRMLFPEKRHLEVRIKIKMVIHIQYLDERNVLFFPFTWTG